ncbi:MAG: hypothetical protein BWX88_01436 [Planctomycetes bacterium ADurb.Bin126]|nr:MAG: hypothetical protein BWX88_01436 [Planctomycetes bacterium ADurb.Bin126]HQL72403.1 hypothetical protein [Phycisphaerae bacterium]
MKTETTNRMLWSLVLAVALCALPLQAGVVITPSAGYSISWDGNEADYFNPASPAPAHASLTTGATAFGSSQYGAGVHLIANANDVYYGNSNSWLPSGSDTAPYIGINFGSLQTVGAIAFGRDNGNDPERSGTNFTDRSLGLYTLQYTQVSSPGTGTGVTGNPSTGWATIGTLNYASDDDSSKGGPFTSYYRHQYSVAQNGQPLEATGLRIVPQYYSNFSSTICIDEVEAYGGSSWSVPAGNLQAWLKGDAGTIPDTSGRLATWTDQAGQGHDAVQGNAAARPTIVPSGIAGNQSVGFAPTQWIDLPNTGTALNIADSDYEIFVVASSASQAVQFLTGAGSNSGTLKYELHINGQAGARFIPASTSGTDLSRFADFGPAGIFADGKPHVYNIRVDGNTGYIRVDGMQAADIVAANARSSYQQVLTLGLRGDGTYPLTGQMGEVLVYNRALSASERSQVEQYLFARHDIPSFQLAEVGGSLVQYNVAAQSRGGKAFAKDCITGYAAHSIPHLNDETYGNNNSWIGTSSWTYAGVIFAEASTIDAIAFGRDNGGEATQLVDRYQGEYVLQYTTADLAILNAALATPGFNWNTITWNTIRVMDYTGQWPGEGYLRHLWQFDAIPDATGVRILASAGGTAIDEIEVRAIPEPVSLACLALACGGIGGYVRRRRAR